MTGGQETWNQLYGREITLKADDKLVAFVERFGAGSGLVHNARESS